MRKNKRHCPIFWIISIRPLGVAAPLGFSVYLAGTLPFFPANDSGRRIYDRGKQKSK